MGLVAVGLSHHTAPVDVREKLAVPAASVPGLLDTLRKRKLGREAVLLSTCNRVELYARTTRDTTPNAIARWLAESGGLHRTSAQKHFYVYREQEALRHLFRVASSLDSMILGEPQILGQVREAYRLAVDHRAVGPMMRGVMERALQVAKRVRTETTIGRETVSVGRAGVNLAAQVVGSLEGRAALLVGAGAHGKVVARAMLDAGLGELVVANRTFGRAVALAERFGGSAAHLEAVARTLERVDVGLTSTAAGRILIDRTTLATVMRRRRYRPLVLIDLSVPRNIAPGVHTLEGVYRFDVDDLTGVAASGQRSREAAAVDAERIIAEEAERCWGLLQIQQVGTQIGQVTRRAERIRREELARAHMLDRLSPEDRAVVEAMTRAMVKKILHPALTRARGLAAAGERSEFETLVSALLDPRRDEDA